MPVIPAQGLPHPALEGRATSGPLSGPPSAPGVATTVPLLAPLRIATVPLVAVPLATVPLLKTSTVPLVTAPLLTPALLDPVLVRELLPLLEPLLGAPLLMTPLLSPPSIPLSRPPHDAMASITSAMGDHRPGSGANSGSMHADRRTEASAWLVVIATLRAGIELESGRRPERSGADGGAP